MDVETRILLDKADYFELRTAIRDVEAVELDAMKAAHRFAALTHDALKVRNALFERLAEQYGFDPALTYRWDDRTYELIGEPMTTSQK